MTQILVTGGAGFIGSHLCEFLLEKGYNVLSVDNLSLGRYANISDLVINPKFRFIKLDLLDKTNFAGLFKEYDIKTIFHLAANSDISQSHQNPMVDLNNTFFTTIAVLENARINNIREIIFASTSAIYGDTSDNLTENYGPLNPVSHYGAAKLASEAFLCSYAINYKINLWIARFPNIVGEHATHGVIYDFINKLKNDQKELIILGNGEQNKPYLYVKELIHALFFIWEHSNIGLNIYNIGVNSRTKVKEIAEMVLKEMGIDAEIKYTGGDRGWIGDVPEFNYDTTKLSSLGWKPKMSSNEAVLNAIRQILRIDFGKLLQK